MQKLFIINYLILFVVNTFAQSALVIDYFPSNIGDKWIFNRKTYDPSEPPFFYYNIFQVEVIGEKILNNSRNYKIFRNGTSNLYFRVDTNKNAVFEFDKNDSTNNYEKLFIDFNGNEQDTIVYSDSIGISFLSSDSIQFNESKHSSYEYVYNVGHLGWKRVYVKGIGLYISALWTTSTIEDQLKGCIINGDTIVTSLKTIDVLSDSYKLFQNYPNPFNPNTTISYTIPKTSHVSLKVFNILGQEIKVLVNGKKLSGLYNISFDGSNLPSGVYYYRLESHNFSEVKKLLLVK